MAATEAHSAIEAVFRIEQARLIAGLARMVRDVGLAEELAQDAFVTALGEWPRTGVPHNPGAWLMAAAKRRAIDRFRRSRMLERKHAMLASELETGRDGGMKDIEAAEAAMDDDVGDELLALIFTACHPVLPADARVALTLKLLGGLSTGEIARAHLVPEATVAQRIVRAKRTLADAQVPFELPQGAELAQRLASVLEVVYLIFNEGYTATSGGDWMRPALCDEALRLGRMLAELAPQEAEVHGLVALMEIQASRTAARTDAAGEPILLADQDRMRWDRLLIRRGLAALERAQALGQPARSYRLQAEIAAGHARAHRATDTDWPRIAALYAELMRVAPSPVVELNRAVAVAMAQGPAAGLAIVEPLLADKALQRYPWLPAVQGDLLRKLGREDEARAAFARAADLTTNEREQRLLRQRARGAA